MEEKIVAEHKDELKQFREWIEEKKTFPKNLRTLLLLRYLKVSDFSIQEAGELLQYNLEYRAKFPQIFYNRDLTSEEIQSVINTFQIYPLPNYTKERYRITMSRLINEDASKFDVVNVLKFFFMSSDVFFVTAPLNGIPEKEIGIMDFKGFSWWHLMKIVGNLSTIRGFMRYIQEAVPYKIAQNHYVNCSPILTKIMILVKPFINKDLYDAMHFHTEGFESLYEFVPKEILPNEYGGDGGPIDKFFKENLQSIERHNDYLRDDDNWKLIKK